MSPRLLVFTTAVLALVVGPAWAYPATVATPLNMRTGPGTGHGIITVIPRGAIVDVRTCRRNWCEVAYANRRGFVSQRYLTRQRPAPRPPVSAPPPFTPPPPWGPPLPPAPGVCNESAAFWAIGAPASPPVIERARLSAGARTVRVVRPGEAITMEFSPQRLTIELDGANRIARVRCG